MTRLNNTTNKANGFMRAYANADNSGELWQVYGSYSMYKARALERCKARANELDGFSPRIIGHNSSFFTYAFKFIDELTGVIKLMVITACNEYVMDLI